MAIRRPPRGYLGTVAEHADAASHGPQSVEVGDEFWGHPNLRLRCEAMPRPSGVVHSRVVYANLADCEQTQAILREATFDARATRLSILRDFKETGAPSRHYPVVCVRYVWVGIDWLETALRSLEGLSAPLGTSRDFAFYETYILGICRPNGTSIQLTWGVGTPGGFEALTAAWEAIWEEMGDLLQGGEPVVPEEIWPLDTAPDYERGRVGVEVPEDGDWCAGCDEVGLAGR